MVPALATASHPPNSATLNSSVMSNAYNATECDSEKGADSYDSDGAAMFMIVVILTYTMSIVGLIATFTVKKKRNLIQDQEATHYLKYRMEAFQALSKVRLTSRSSFLQPVKS